MPFIISGSCAQGAGWFMDFCLGSAFLQAICMEDMSAWKDRCYWHVGVSNNTVWGPGWFLAQESLAQPTLKESHRICGWSLGLDADMIWNVNGISIISKIITTSIAPSESFPSWACVRFRWSLHLPKLTQCIMELELWTRHAATPQRRSLAIITWCCSPSISNLSHPGRFCFWHWIPVDKWVDWFWHERSPTHLIAGQIWGWLFTRRC